MWHLNYQVKSSKSSPNEAGAPKVSMDQYEALLELYQGAKRSSNCAAGGTDQLAPDIYSKAVQIVGAGKRM
jgi:hypothetical protein